MFAVPTGDLTQDERGHAIPATNRIKVMATLKVKPLTFAHSKIQRPCLEPVPWPHSSLPPNWAKATWNGQRGYFDLTDPLNPPDRREGLGAL